MSQKLAKEGSSTDTTVVRVRLVWNLKPLKRRSWPYFDLFNKTRWLLSWCSQFEWQAASDQWNVFPRPSLARYACQSSLFPWLLLNTQQVTDSPFPEILYATIFSKCYTTVWKRSTHPYSLIFLSYSLSVTQFMGCVLHSTHWLAVYVIAPSQRLSHFMSSSYLANKGGPQNSKSEGCIWLSFTGHSIPGFIAPSSVFTGKTKWRCFGSHHGHNSLES